MLYVMKIPQNRNEVGLNDPKLQLRKVNYITKYSTHLLVHVCIAEIWQLISCWLILQVKNESVVLNHHFECHVEIFRNTVLLTTVIASCSAFFGYLLLFPDFVSLLPQLRSFLSQCAH